MAERDRSRSRSRVRRWLRQAFTVAYLIPVFVALAVVTVLLALIDRSRLSR